MTEWGLSFDPQYSRSGGRAQAADGAKCFDIL